MADGSTSRPGVGQQVILQTRSEADLDHRPTDLRKIVVGRDAAVGPSLAKVIPPRRLARSAVFSRSALLLHCHYYYYHHLRGRAGWLASEPDGRTDLAAAAAATHLPFKTHETLSFFCRSPHSQPTLCYLFFLFFFPTHL